MVNFEFIEAFQNEHYLFFFSLDLSHYIEKYREKVFLKFQS